MSWGLQSLSCLAPFLNAWCSGEPGTCQSVNSVGYACWGGGSPLPLCKTAQFLWECRQIASLCWGSVAILFSCFPRLSVLQGADHGRTLWQGLVMQRSLETSLGWEDLESGIENLAFRQKFNSLEDWWFWPWRSQHISTLPPNIFSWSITEITRALMWCRSGQVV